MLSFSNAKDVGAKDLEAMGNERQSLIRREVESYLQSAVLEIDRRVDEAWKVDYTSPEAFTASVEPHRQDWIDCLGVAPAECDPLEAKRFPYYEDENVVAEWVILPFKNELRCHGALAMPKNAGGPLPLVIAQHGVSSTPEQIFGLRDADGHYHSFGKHLLDQGYAVLAPINVNGGPQRSRLHRLAILLGGSLAGIEVRKYQRWIDYLETLPEIDAGRIAMWGLSMGGFYVLITQPVEPRIKVGINAAFFNHRVTKMAFEDPKYSSFLPLKDQGEHAYIPGWLTKFRDSELAALTCPRPLQIQAGKCDGISWHPLLSEEFERARHHYERLGMRDRIELLLHEGGHEVKVAEGIAFLDKWL